jgi:hypothetical protein
LLTDDELAGLEDEIRAAKDTFRGLLAWVPDPYSRGTLHGHLDKLVHSANKWLDHCIAEAASGAAQSATAQLAPGTASRGISNAETVTGS